ncbi:gephyrin-like molybdotransferase Glp [Methylomicrobium sp. Wu6]|uniref:molybdopterin molybdotransferase MoeA n=1 Tax=Methylomicrobium sp. Wu6 TaxID=3107928 RepID=UPI002DD65D71|nr:gephyrin-like molybdotransferase Glp [Methylomicrobium sp. Wu6]MEC4750631.1 gephyrin-like molybdotransferase Glp [Methylomicrobium sp. Wu6]
MIDLCSLENEPMLSVEAARERIAAALEPVIGVEKTALKYALGRVLAEPVCSPLDIPHDRNAAVDGYAFSSRDIDTAQAFRLHLAGASWAGKPFQGQLNAGECIRIFTGAVLPREADSVVMQEFVTVDGDYTVFPAAVPARRFVRETGEDVKSGGILCGAGKKLTAIELGLFASAGIYDVVVKRPVNIAFFSTGDELTGIGKPLAPGKIHDSNRYILGGLLTDPCYCAADLGVIGDDMRQLEDALSQAALNHDVIITTGGASVGEADFITRILERLGEVHLWKIAMKPGKPFAFGKIGKAFFFGLPGNPVAVAVTFQQIVKPGLGRLTGLMPASPLRIKAMLTAPLKKEPGRLEFQRGILTQNADGEFFVASAGGQGSHMLGSMSASNCYIILPADCCGVQANEPVWVEPFQTSL